MFRKALLLIGAMAIATPAMAAEMTNPFYGPAKGKIYSDTSVEFERTQYKNDGFDGRIYQTRLAETVRYGIMDNVSIDGTISNDWRKDAPGVERDNMNVNWALGATWAPMYKDKAKVQFSAKYGQDDTWPWEAGIVRYGKLKADAGYDFGVVMPYVSAEWTMPFANGSVGYEKPVYGARAGLYKFWCDKIATDLGASYTHYEEWEGTNWAVDAEVSYFFTPNVAVGIYANYVWDGKEEEKTSVYDKKIGARLRAQF